MSVALGERPKGYGDRNGNGTIIWKVESEYHPTKQWREPVLQAEGTVTGLCGYRGGQRQRQARRPREQGLLSSLLANVAFGIRQKGMGKFVIDS